MHDFYRLLPFLIKFLNLSETAADFSKLRNRRSNMFARLFLYSKLRSRNIVAFVISQACLSPRNSSAPSRIVNRISYYCLDSLALLLPRTELISSPRESRRETVTQRESRGRTIVIARTIASKRPCGGSREMKTWKGGRRGGERGGGRKEKSKSSVSPLGLSRGERRIRK